MPITGGTRLAGVIGTPIRHSLSPAIFNAAFGACGLDWVYLAFDVPAGRAREALDAMRVLDIGGLSVTMPHKDAVADAVDRCSPAASALHAVNCVVPTGDGLVGDNTDGQGFIDALRAEVDFPFEGCRVAIFGAGGAARAVAHAVGNAGAGAVAIVNRSHDKAVTAAALAGDVGRVAGTEAIEGADLVVNATSVGMGDGGVPFDPALLHPGQVVADIVYHPRPTPLVAAARDRGITAVDGLGMLVQQAAHAFSLWTGQRAPLDAMTDAAKAGLVQEH